MIVAVITGGPSSEAEVSRASARGVTDALRSAGHEVIVLELDRSLGEKLTHQNFDVVFPVSHGAVGEDGSLQGLLEVHDLPYVGSGVLASALAMSKPVAKKLFVSVGLPVARGLTLTRSDPPRAATRCVDDLGAHLVVKPAAGGSALGVSRLKHASIEQIVEALEAVWAVDEAALVEQFIEGREVTCAVLEDEHGVRALAATEITSPNDAFYTYAARYAPGRSVHVCPAPLGELLTRRVHELAVAAHVALQCRDLCRVDFVVSDDTSAESVTLLEVNTMPGFTPTSLYPEAATAAGIPFPSLCDLLVKRARARGAPRRNAAVPLPR